jgi:hypothetical protein
MRRFIPTRALLVFILPLSTLHCSDAGVAGELEDVAEGTGEGAEGNSDVTASEAALDSAAADTGIDTCRSFTTRAVLDVGLDQGKLECSFDAESLRHVCSQGVAGSNLITTRDYASVEDFVEAGRHMGKVTSLGEVRSGQGQLVRLRHYYDELGRLARSVEEHPLGDISHRYGDYDDAGRPRQELTSGLHLDGCDPLSVAIAYDDRLGQVERTYRAAPACDLDLRREVEQYDAVGNPLRMDVDQGSGPETRLLATPSALESVCP